MKKRIRNGFSKLQINEYLRIFCLPLFACLLTLLLVNQNKVYVAETLITPTISPFTGLKGSHLAKAGFSRSAIKMIRAQSKRLEQASVSGVVEKIEILKSKQLLAGFIVEHKLKPLLFKGEWDKVNQQWRGEEPSDYMASEMLGKRLKINDKSSFIKVSIKWEYAEPAAFLVNEFIGFANRQINERDTSAIKKQIATLEKLLEKDDNPVAVREFLENNRASLYTALNTRLPSISTAFQVIDSAHIPDEPTLKIPIILLLAEYVVLSGSLYIALRVRRITRVHAANPVLA